MRPKGEGKKGNRPTSKKKMRKGASKWGDFDCHPSRGLEIPGTASILVGVERFLCVKGLTLRSGGPEKKWGWPGPATQNFNSEKRLTMQETAGRTPVDYRKK